MAFKGMDTAAGAAAAALLDGQIEILSQFVVQASAAVDAIQWFGTDATHFRQNLWPEVTAAMNAAISSLAMQRDDLRRHVDDQTRTSNT